MQLGTGQSGNLLKPFNSNVARKDFHLADFAVVDPALNKPAGHQHYQLNGWCFTTVINNSTTQLLTPPSWLPRHQGTKTIMDSEERRNASLQQGGDPLPWAIALVPVLPSGMLVTTAPRIADDSCFQQD